MGPRSSYCQKRHIRADIDGLIRCSLLKLCLAEHLKTVKLYVVLIKYYPMQAYEGVEVSLVASLNSELVT
jgi:hypothetical protein